MNKSKGKITPFAKKSFGQNFLVDQNYISKIISALNPQTDETIVEIGAGRGALTEKLIKSGAEIIAIELDNDLIPLLQSEFGENGNFHLIEQDALTIDFEKLTATKNPKPKTKLVANLPYYISTAILQHLMRFKKCFSEMVLMLQKEVVDRITAEPGNKERGFLTVLTEAYFHTEKLFDVPPKAFRPVPKVMSSVVRLRPKKDEISPKDDELFRQIISLGFRQKRKTIFNNLKNADKILYNKNVSHILEEVKINPKRRAETLNLNEWIDLANILTEEK